MSELNAAVGLVHLRHLDEFVAIREGVARKYDNGLASIPWLTPLQAAPALRCNYYKYPVLLDPRLDRTALKAAFKDHFQITLSGEVYDTPLHLQPVFEPFVHGELPCAERFCAQHVCLPVHSDMTDREVERVLEAAGAVCRDLVRN